MIRTNIRINIHIKNIRIIEYLNIFVTLCFGNRYFDNDYGHNMILKDGILMEVMANMMKIICLCNCLYLLKNCSNPTKTDFQPPLNAEIHLNGHSCYYGLP